jgi:tetratricopeptide (TPR) repeat protein
MTARRLLPVLAFMALAWAGGAAFGADTLPDLRRRLLEANRPEMVGHALDRLQAHIGEPGWFADAGAFADWLAEIPDGRALHTLVLQRRGWGYMNSGRGAEGIAPLERALADDPSDALTTAYLAECLRLSGRLMDAAEMMARAATSGFREPYLEEALVNVAVTLRQAGGVKEAAGLPDYVRALGPYLLVRPSAALHAMLAGWLGEDLARHDRPTTERGRLWARCAGDHALAAVADLATDLPDAAALLHGAATALAAQHDDPTSRALAFELLCHAVRRGQPRSEGERHQRPEALLDLAELAITEGRHALAARLLAQRAECGRTPRIGRLARLLPPDLETPN